MTPDALGNQNSYAFDPYEHILGTEAEGIIKDAVSRLPEDQQRVVAARVEEKPFSEIAAKEGKSINTVLGQQRYARAALWKDKIVNEYFADKSPTKTP